MTIFSTVRVGSITVVLLVGLIAAAQQDLSPGKWDCSLVQANPVRLSKGIALRLAVKKVRPTQPMNSRVDALVVLEIAVNENGDVECVRARSGHPLLISVSIHAAKDWRFKPYRLNGRAVPFVSELYFRFTDDRVKYE
jgi:hypothetical protein